MTYAPNPAERAWIDAAVDPTAAAPFVPLAAAFNRLDAGLLAPLLTEGCLYESQSVLEELRGKATVLEYLGEKFEALRAAGTGHLISAELAADPGGRPTALLRQRASCYGRPELGAIVGFYRLTAAGDGRIGRLFLTTSVPPPGLCRGTGLFPGMTEEQVRQARGFVGERIPLSADLVFTLFAMPRVVLCEEMARDLRSLVAEFGPARLEVVTPKDREVCIDHGVTGFPTLLIIWRGETVRVLDGYHSNEQIRAALADLFL